MAIQSKSHIRVQNYKERADDFFKGYKKNGRFSENSPQFQQYERGCQKLTPKTTTMRSIVKYFVNNNEQMFSEKSG